jgi:ABC-type glutathione transport system ATPase component
MEPLLRVEHVTISYNGKPVVQDISFLLNPGEILGVVGESGSGKSTIIKAIMGLLGNTGLVTRGDIYYKGQNIVDMPKKEQRRLLGPEIGMVFQDCTAALCPIRTIGAQLYESLREHEKITRKAADIRAGELLQKIGLTDYQRVLDSYPFELSGGMNQRVGICAAMMLKPSLLLADEPTSALDVTVQAQVVNEMLLMRREYGTAMILVTHNIGVAEAMADQVLVLKDGNSMDYGPADRVLNHSENEYTKTLMNSVLHLRRTPNE